MNKTIIEFTGEELVMLRGVMACTAKNDIRYYLKGFHINSEHVVATDGSRIAKFNTPHFDGELPEKGVIIPTIKIPFSVHTVIITIEDDKITVDRYSKQGKTTEVYQTIEANYPLYRKVLADRGKTALDKVAFSPALISEVAKAIKATITQIEFTAGGELSLIYVNIPDLPEFTFSIMPARY
jgi:DNA polymerase III sliding clamp (beta) subunit (PCNA family)